jgi:3-hydroxyisobutyrate dehydrogenase-like beta-hydroxyacid dehydrogenase
MIVTAHDTRIGFCGIGKMGEPMVHRLLDAGHVMRIWNRTDEKLRGLVERGAIAYPSPAALADDVDIAMLCLADDAAVDETIFGKNGLARAAHTPVWVVDHSTISPSRTKEFAQRWHELRGGFWIDAPVSGGTMGATDGTLAIMTGSETAGAEAVEAIMYAYAAHVTRMGATGAGQMAKLANQTIVATTIAGIAEAVTLAQRSGISAGLLPDAMRGGWADSVLLQTLLPRMLYPPAKASGTIKIMLKDLDAIEEIAEQTGTRLNVLPQVRILLVKAVQSGLGDADISQLIRVIGRD